MAASMFARAGLEQLGAVRLSQIGLGMAACGLLIISFWPMSLGSAAASAIVIGALALHGFGYGLFQVAAVDVVMATMPRTQQGVGGSLNMLTRTLGVVAGASLGSILFAALGGGAQADDTTFHTAYATVFWIACALVLLAMGILALIGRQDTASARLTGVVSPGDFRLFNSWPLVGLTHRLMRRAWCSWRAVRRAAGFELR